MTADKCIRCGLVHGQSDTEIAKSCGAVKSVKYTSYVYGPNGTTVSYPHISEIGYIDIEQQERLLIRNWQLPETETKE